MRSITSTKREGLILAIRVWTIGHSTRAFEDVVTMLRATAITVLVDVRSYPASRKFPQWNQAAIIEEMPTDIDYRWLQKLGGRRHTSAGVESPNGGWRVKAFRDYADYMQTTDFADGMSELLELSDHQRPAIMCSEAVPWRCHRRLITDALIVAGAEVRHIMSASTTTRATLSDFAHVDDGNLTYPPDR